MLICHRNESNLINDVFSTIHFSVRRYDALAGVHLLDSCRPANAPAAVSIIPNTVDVKAVGDEMSLLYIGFKSYMREV